MSAINFCKDPRISFWDIVLTKLDYTPTHRQTHRNTDRQTDSWWKEYNFCL